MRNLVKVPVRVLLGAGLILLLGGAGQALAECRAPQACIECHAVVGYPPANVLENIAEGTCERGDFSRGQDLSLPRFIHKASVLDDNRVLLTGGAFAIWQITNTVDVFDPVTNTISPAANMSVQRWGHSSTTLPDGRVLVAGGRTGISPASAVVLATAEIYDPATNTWSPTGSMNVARRSHTETLLPNGSVLICGGGDSVSTSGQMPIQSCELYDPATGAFSIAGDMTVARTSHNATLLDDGSVLIAGGSVGAGTSTPTNLAELYDPSDNSFTPVGPMNFTRLAQAPAKLRDGRVVFGNAYAGAGAISPDSEIYDPATQAFTIIDDMVKQRIDIGGLTLLDGTVLIAGGVATGSFGAIFHSSSEVYDPVADRWRLSGIMSDGRDEFSGALLSDGRVLITGGFTRPAGQTTGSRLLDTVEIYTAGLTQQIAGLINVTNDLPASVLASSNSRAKLLGDIDKTSKKIDKDDYDGALKKAEKLLGSASVEISDISESERVQSIVQVLINSLSDELSPNLPPTVTASATPDSGTEPLPVSFAADASDPDGAIASYLWVFGDGAISSDQNPAHTFECDGTYTASVQVADDQGAVASDEVAITVASAGGPVTYGCDVQPVFDRNCISCHGTSKGLSVQSCQQLQQGSNSGPVIDPGSKETSVLWQRIDAGTMPPQGGRLPQVDIDGIGAWIDSLDPNDPDYCD